MDWVEIINDDRRWIDQWYDSLIEVLFQLKMIKEKPGQFYGQPGPWKRFDRTWLYLRLRSYAYYHQKDKVE